MKALRFLPALVGLTFAVGLNAQELATPSQERAAGIVTCKESHAAIVVRAGEKEIFRYHKAEVQSPEGMDPIYGRSGYIHPVCTPSGRVVTGDFAPDHAHQHALFSAWVKTEFENHPVDFWNLHGGTGRIAHKRVMEVINRDQGVSFRVEMVHVDVTDADRPTPAIYETWTLRIPQQTKPYFVFDLFLQQRCASEAILHVLENSYGGMGLRGNRQLFRADGNRIHGDWVKTKAAKPDGDPPSVDEMGYEFLTSEGHHRLDGNHTHPRWVDMFGKVDGEIVGMTVLCHPDSFRAPQAVRLHPTKPYFCFAPVVNGPFDIKPEQDYSATYRYLVHDGPPNVEQIEAEWARFAEE